MAEIAEQLRHWATKNDDISFGDPTTAKLCRQAATEIDRLARALLATLKVVEAARECIQDIAERPSELGHVTLELELADRLDSALSALDKEIGNE